MEYEITLVNQVRTAIFSMYGDFTIEDIIKKLYQTEILTEENKNKVLEIINELLESSLIKHIPFSNKYYIYE